MKTLNCWVEAECRWNLCKNIKWREKFIRENSNQKVRKYKSSHDGGDVEMWSHKFQCFWYHVQDNFHITNSHFFSYIIHCLNAKMWNCCFVTEYIICSFVRHD